MLAPAVVAGKLQRHLEVAPRTLSRTSMSRMNRVSPLSLILQAHHAEAVDCLEESLLREVEALLGTLRGADVGVSTLIVEEAPASAVAVEVGGTGTR